MRRLLCFLRIHRYTEPVTVWFERWAYGLPYSVDAVRNACPHCGRVKL